MCTRSELLYLLQANPKAKVADPIQGMIIAINKYLQAYHMYRAEALSRPEVRRLDTMSRDALATLPVQKEPEYPHPQGQLEHGGGGGDRAGARPGRNRFALRVA